MQETETSGPSPGRIVPGLERYRALSFDHGLVLAGLAAALGFAVEASSFGGARGPIAVLAVVVALAAVGLRRHWPLEMLFVVAAAVVAAPAPGLVLGPVLVILFLVAACLGP